MKAIFNYIRDIFRAIRSLILGMAVTIRQFFTKKVTEQYPESRETLYVSARFRGELVMPHDENNEHACTACGICQINCPNGTIQVISRMEESTEPGGKPKKVLDRHIYDLGMCTFCDLCVITCPSNAIKFDNTFEHSLYTREKLVHQLNREGSKIREKKKTPQ